MDRPFIQTHKDGLPIHWCLFLSPNEHFIEKGVVYAHPNLAVKFLRG